MHVKNCNFCKKNGEKLVKETGQKKKKKLRRLKKSKIRGNTAEKNAEKEGKGETQRNVKQCVFISCSWLGGWMVAPPMSPVGNNWSRTPVFGCEAHRQHNQTNTFRHTHPQNTQLQTNTIRQTQIKHTNRHTRRFRCKEANTPKHILSQTHAGPFLTTHGGAFFQAPGWKKRLLAGKRLLADAS